MALNPTNAFIGQIGAPSADYPFGQAQDITVPGDGTGTPFEALLLNDIFGFQQALLSESGITPSGTPDKVDASQYLDAIYVLSGLRSFASLANAAATDLTRFDRIITASYLGGWEDTPAGPKGTAIYHRDNTTGTPSAIFANRNGFFDTEGKGFSLSAGQKTNYLMFGAKGDDATNDTLAVLAALDFGGIVSGLGLSYAVTGNIGLPEDIELIDAEFKQLIPEGAGDVRTLTSSNVSNITLSRITVNKNGDGTNGDVALDAGIWIQGGTGHNFEDVTVYGDDIGSGFSVHNASDFTGKYIIARDMNYDLGANPDANRLNGIFMSGCTDFSLENPIVRVLGGDFGGGATTQHTTGILTEGCTDFRVSGHRINDTGRGLVLEGTVGNQDFTIADGKVKDIRDIGHFFNISAFNGQVNNCSGRDCGYSSFANFGPDTGISVTPGNVVYTGCKSYDVGSNGIWSLFSPTAFLSLVGVQQVTTPLGIKYYGCSAIDEQGTETMVSGFASDVPAPSDGNYNECINCTSKGETGDKFNGMHSAYVEVVLNAVQSHTNTGSFQTINWTAQNDKGDMHDLSVNPNRVTIRQEASYIITGRVSFAAFGLGTRGIRLRLNAAFLTRTETFILPQSIQETAVSFNITLYLKEGDFLDVQSFQDSGGNLNMTTRSIFDVTRVYNTGSV